MNRLNEFIAYYDLSYWIHIYRPYFFKSFKLLLFSNNLTSGMLAKLWVLGNVHNRFKLNCSMARVMMLRNLISAAQ